MFLVDNIFGFRSVSKHWHLSALEMHHCQRIVVIVASLSEGPGETAMSLMHALYLTKVVAGK